MKINTTTVLTMRDGEQFVRPGKNGAMEPLTIGWACMEGLDNPPVMDGRPEQLSKSEKIRRDKLAVRFYEADGEVEITAEEAAFLIGVVNGFLSHPRAAAEAIRLIDPEAYARG